MRVDNYQVPKSSFLSVDKDMSIITDRIIKNDRLKKLLYYTSADCLSRPNLSDEQTMELFTKNIKIIPKLYIDKEVLNYLTISFDNFVTNETNPEFRDNTIQFDIICHFDQWALGDFSLRPYKIAAEIDSMFNNQRLTGIGKLEFMGGVMASVNDEFGGISMLYRAIHGDEDKKNAPKAIDEKSLKENFDKIFNINEWTIDQD